MAIPDDDLDLLGISEGTDKNSLFNDYLRYYEFRFRPFRLEPINLIEIGIGAGNSLAMWRRYFPNATIIGVDIDTGLVDAARRLLGDSVQVEIGSQDDPTFLSDLCGRFPPTIVIDDGSHFARHMLFTFRHVFPFLLPGGWYVIEDLWIAMGMDELPLMPHRYLADIAASNVALKRHDEPSDPLRSLVETVEFVPGMAFVRRHDPEARLRRLLAAVPVAERTAHASNLAWLAEAILNHGGPLDVAETAARRAVARRDDFASYQSSLSVVLDRQGKTDEALARAKSAVDLDPATLFWHERYWKLLAKMGRGDDVRVAIDAAMRAVEPGYSGFLMGERRRLCGDEPSE